MSSSESETRKGTFKIDFSDVNLSDLSDFSFGNEDTIIIFLPLPSIGRTNSHIDICADLRDASFAAEALAKYAGSAKAVHDYPDRNTTRIKLTLKTPTSELKDTLTDCYLLFNGCDEDEKYKEKFDDLCNQLYEYEDNIGKSNPLVPEIVEWYFSNLVGGAYYEMQSEAPDYYQEQIKIYPERQLGFHRSAYSSLLLYDCYASPDSWLIPNKISLADFFSITDIEYFSDDFEEGTIFSLEGASFVKSNNQIVYFPMNQYFKSRTCASLAILDPDDEWPSDKFAWQDATFTHSPFGEQMRSMIPESLRALDPHREKCTVHTSGALLCVDDGMFFHLLFDTKPLNLHETKNLFDHVCSLSDTLAGYVGHSKTITCDWKSLTDENFEQLCYDIIYTHPNFDSETIKKMGKSRSRDGGRDIVVYEKQNFRGKKPKKWIFQCKLVRDNTSLGATKLSDVGDMLEQYDAEGFGVMTSSFIDATLYDKLEKICQKRMVKELHFSVFEIERLLARNPVLKSRYFNTT